MENLYHLLLREFIDHFSFPWLHRSTCNILVSQLGIEPGPLQWECTVLTIGLPGNSWSLLRISGFFCPKLPSNLFEHSLVYWSLNIFCYINLQHITFLSYSLGPWKIATEAYKCDLVDLKCHGGNESLEDYWSPPTEILIQLISDGTWESINILKAIILGDPILSLETTFTKKHIS